MTSREGLSESFEEAVRSIDEGRVREEEGALERDVKMTPGAWVDGSC